MSDQSQHFAGHRQRVRNRLRRESALIEDYELLELLLGLVLLRRDTKTLAKDLLARFGTLTDVLNAPEEALVQVKGVGPGITSLWLLLRELRARYAETPLRHRESLCSPEEVAAMARARLAGKREEELWLALVDSQNRLLSWQRLSRGTANGVYFTNREVLRLALEQRAWGFFLVHNHPGGNPMPSSRDLETTRSLSQAASQMELTFLDHLVVTETSAYSITESQLIDYEPPVREPRTSQPFVQGLASGCSCSADTEKETP